VPDTPPSWDDLISEYRACVGIALNADAVDAPIEIMAYLKEALSLQPLMDTLRLDSGIEQILPHDFQSS